jgi:hypothetical protein
MIIDNNFTNCTSTGYGGAITSNWSLITTLRVIKNCNLYTCTCIENKGNDFADMNGETNVMSLYELWNINWWSEYIKFYLMWLNLALDCIVDKICEGLDTVYVCWLGVNQLWELW